MLTRMHSHAGAWERDKIAMLFLIFICLFGVWFNTSYAQTQGVCEFDESKGPQMVVIDSGVFVMGSPEDEKGRRSGEDQHQVTIVKPFAIGRCEVTFDEYDRFAKVTGRELPDDKGWGRGKRPVINVSWADAVAYTDWLSKRTGENYRLPTEAEWEYAARAGSTTPFNTGECVSTDQANYNGNVDYAGCGTKTGVYRNKTIDVGSFKANAFGLHDMHGNVREWTADCWQADGDCTVRVLRGGSWFDRPRGLRSADRVRDLPGARVNDIGFRLARTL